MPLKKNVLAFFKKQLTLYYILSDNSSVHTFNVKPAHAVLVSLLFDYICIRPYISLKYKYTIHNSWFSVFEKFQRDNNLRGFRDTYLIQNINRFFFKAL